MAFEPSAHRLVIHAETFPLLVKRLELARSRHAHWLFNEKS